MKTEPCYVAERFFLISFIELCYTHGFTFVNSDSYECFLIAPLTSDRMKDFVDGIEDINCFIDKSLYDEK